MIDAALDYAARGWPVFPIVPRGKTPLVKHGFQAATTDAQQLERWWRQWPNANIGLALGGPGPTVLDVDDPKSPDARHFTGTIGTNPPVVETSRGFHLYFAGQGEPTVTLTFGEVRGVGAYAIAPPSVHPGGKRYVWKRDNDTLPVLSNAVYDYRKAPAAGTGDAQPVAHVAPGGMHDHLLDFAVRLARAGVLDREARAAALRAEFARVRVPGAQYEGDERDTDRLADAPSAILAREAEKVPAVTTPPPAASTGAPPSGGARVRLRFRTPADLRADTPAEPKWLWRGSLAEGLLTVVGGRPKVGKSTVIYQAIDRMVRGEAEFLGASLAPTDVVVLSEEHAITALNKLSDSPRLHVVTRDFAWPTPAWDEAIGDALAAAREYEAKLVVVDSFTFWAGLDAEGGNLAGAVQARLTPLIEASHDGVATLLIHHQRKAGGEYGDALLGSTAFAANADIILEVERLGEGAPANFRRIMRLGRWPVAPVLLAAYRDEVGYELVAEADSTIDAEDLGWAERIRQLLQPAGKVVRQTELEALLGVDGRTWARGAALLVASGEATRQGAGGAKDPITYTLLTPGARDALPEI